MRSELKIAPSTLERMALEMMIEEKKKIIMKSKISATVAIKLLLDPEEKTPAQLLKELFRIEISLCDTSVYNKYSFIKSSKDNHPVFVVIKRPVQSYDGWVVVSYIGDTLRYKAFYNYEEAKNHAFNSLRNKQ